MRAIGIDPGLDGALALLERGKLLVEDMPTLRLQRGREIDIPRLAVILSEWGCSALDTRVIVERQQAMPGQGVSSTLKTGIGYGVILGVLGALRIPFERVQAQQWKRKFGLLRSDKRASIARARELHPDAPLSLSKHHGRAEAILIAEWAR